MPKCTYLLTLLPVLCKHCRRLADFFVFQQDSAPAHRARDTLQLLQRDTPEFIAPDLWPPNSPDLNPLDYKIWGMMQQVVYQTRICDITELKERLIDVWRGLQQSVLCRG